MENIWKDLTYGLRTLMRHRLFTALAILALALGIGANAAIFSFVNATSLQPLPFEEPEKLVLVSGTIERDGFELRAASYPEYRDWTRQTQTLESLAAFAWAQGNLTGGEEAERVQMTFATPSYFSTFRLVPELGRGFTEADDAPPSGLPVAIISERLWRDRYGGDPGIVGRSIEVDGRSLTVTGVMPPGFRGVAGDRDLWIPLRHSTEMIDDRSVEDFDNRDARWLQVVARRAPGVSLEQARTEMAGIADRLRRSYPASHEDRGAEVLSLEENLLGDVSSTSLVLFVAVGFLWLLACTNVISLILVRMERRKKEVAVRLSVGAQRRWILRQVMTETLLLSMAGGVVGLLVAHWGTGLVESLSPVQLPEYIDIGVDLQVFGFIFALALLTGTLLGCAPILRVFRTDLTNTLKEGGEASRPMVLKPMRHLRPQALLVMAEVAIALLVLVGAILVIRSFAEERSIDPGFDAEEVMTFRLQLPTVEYSGEEAAEFVRVAENRLQALPGVRAVGLTSDMPLDDAYSAAYATTEERYARDPENRVRMYYHRVSPDFFASLGVPFVRGSTFDDTAGGDGDRQVVIDRRLAERLWPNENPIGHTLVIVRPPGFRVVGVVGEVRYRNLLPNPEQIPEDSDVYLPILGSSTRNVSVLLRTEGDPQTILPAARMAMREIAPGLPLFQAQPMSDLLADETALTRLSSVLFGLFGFAALLLAVIGIYGLMAYSVNQRRREFGIRMALGAEVAAIRRQVVKEGLRITFIGLLVGGLAAVLGDSLFESFLFDAGTIDPMTLVGVALGLLIVGVVASYLPARRASKVSPLASLKSA